ncbi:MAG: biotin--[acetyl-CoA-carboxylase] ligase [Aggregatilineales bacterium]
MKENKEWQQLMDFDGRRESFPAFSGRAMQWHEQVTSTNDLGIAWLRDQLNPPPDGAVIIANVQTRGRGRFGRSWYAPPGSALLFTYLLRPPAKYLARAGMLGALAVCEALEALGAHDLTVKWPNDVHLGGRKICGVLPEACWQADHLLGVALGIGINVRVHFVDPALAVRAASLEPALKRAVDRNELLAAVLERLDHWRARLQDPALFSAWRARLNVFGRAVTVDMSGSVLSGTAEAVEETGALLLRLEDGKLERVVAGDLSFV